MWDLLYLTQVIWTRRKRRRMMTREASMLVCRRPRRRSSRPNSRLRPKLLWRLSSRQPALFRQTLTTMPRKLKGARLRRVRKELTQPLLLRSELSKKLLKEKRKKSFGSSERRKKGLKEKRKQRKLDWRLRKLQRKLKSKLSLTRLPSWKQKASGSVRRTLKKRSWATSEGSSWSKLVWSPLTMLSRTSRRVASLNVSGKTKRLSCSRRNRIIKSCRSTPNRKFRISSRLKSKSILFRRVTTLRLSRRTIRLQSLTTGRMRLRTSLKVLLRRLGQLKFTLLRMMWAAARRNLKWISNLNQFRNQLTRLKKTSQLEHLHSTNSTIKQPLRDAKGSVRLWLNARNKQQAQGKVVTRRSSCVVQLFALWVM